MSRPHTQSIRRVGSKDKEVAKIGLLAHARGRGQYVYWTLSLSQKWDGIHTSPHIMGFFFPSPITRKRNHCKEWRKDVVPPCPRFTCTLNANL